MELVIILLIVLLALVWTESMASRETAYAAAMDICSRRGLLLLDETVALASRSLVRGPRGSLILRRTYTFDYCEDASSRQSGFVVLEGRRLCATGLAADSSSGSASSQAHEFSVRDIMH